MNILINRNTDSGVERYIYKLICAVQAVQVEYLKYLPSARLMVKKHMF